MPLAGSFLFVPLGAFLFLAAPWLAHGVSELDLVLIRGLLGPGSPDSTALTERVRNLEVTRARAVDDSAARLRSIERDLHDGAQAQLVALAMKLGLAKEKLGVAAPPDLTRVSQYVETRYAADLLRTRSGGVGYLLKDRVADVGEFVDAITRVAAGGTAFDPEVVSGMLNATRHASTLAALTARERDVLALMAEGRSNSAIADRLVVSERAVEKHISNIFSKLGLPPSDSDHRRVLAVLAYLGS